MSLLKVSNKADLKQHIRFFMMELDRHYCKDDVIGFEDFKGTQKMYRTVRKYEFAKKFILERATKEFTRQYDVNGLLLLEAIDELKQELKNNEQEI